MLQLRVFGDSSAVGEVARRLGALPGARHVSVVAGERRGSALLTADLRAVVADGALDLARGVGIPPEDIWLLRLDAIGPGLPAEEPVALVWADLLGQAGVNARAAVRYLVFMAVARIAAGVPLLEPRAWASGKSRRLRV
jgi:hypothetical protein